MFYKTLPFFLKELDAKTRTVSGIFAVHGNVDDGGDMSVNGSFAKRLSDGSRKRVRFLWGHDASNPPIASIKDIQEVDKAGLPGEVLQWAPNATGGVQVTRQYYEGIELSEWVFKCIDAGDVTEMSYAYDAIECKYYNDPVQPMLRRGLLDVQLYDISDVNWGMNPVTLGVKHQGMRTDLERMQALLTGLKEGRVLSTSSREKVSNAVDAMESALTALNDLLSASEPAKSLPETGDSLNERSARLVANLKELLEWVQDRKAFREAEGRSLSGVTRDRLAQMTTEIEAILRETQPKSDPEPGALLERRLRAARTLLAPTTH